MTDLSPNTNSTSPRNPFPAHSMSSMAALYPPVRSLTPSLLLSVSAPTRNPAPSTSAVSVTTPSCSAFPGSATTTQPSTGSVMPSRSTPTSATSPAYPSRPPYQHSH